MKTLLVFHFLVITLTQPRGRAKEQNNEETIFPPSPTRINRKNGHKDTKQNCLLKFVFVFWCLGGENVLPHNAQK
jgi:hypothetical protein